MRIEIRELEWSRSFTVQALVVAGTIGVFVAYCIGSLASGQRQILWIGTLLIALGALGARRLRSYDASKTEVFAVAFIGPMLFWLPVVVGEVPVGPSATAAILGSLAFIGTWSLLRFPPVRAISNRGPLGNIRWALSKTFAAAFGIGLYVVGIAIVAALFARDSTVLNELGAILAGYFGAAAAVALVVGVLFPLSRWPLGVILLGIGAASAVYGIVGLFLLMNDSSLPGSTLVQQLSYGLVLGLFVGPVAGLALAYTDASESWA